MHATWGQMHPINNSDSICFHCTCICPCHCTCTSAPVHYCRHRHCFYHLQMFNMINARKVEDEYNVFAGSLNSLIFWSIWVSISAFQVRFVYTPECGQRSRRQHVSRPLRAPLSAPRPIAPSPAP